MEKLGEPLLIAAIQRSRSDLIIGPYKSLPVP